jgi:orotidine-5'-phosphate decarboxylase
LQLCHEWNNKLSPQALGVVAGATDPTALKRIRDQSSDMWILCPGVGAQGGEASVSILDC